MNRTEQAKSSANAAGAKKRVYDLEDRLLEFAAAVIDVAERLPKTRAGNHIAGQFLRSGTSPYGNHGEAQSPESKDDFIHKMKVCLKELRETRRWARLIERKNWLPSDAQLAFVLQEGEELIRIFNASVQTAERNRIATARVSANASKSQGSDESRSRFKVRWFKVQGSIVTIQCWMFPLIHKRYWLRDVRCFP